MMIVNILDGVTEWSRENICEKLSLKLPDDDVNDSGYEPKYVKPAAFALYIPAKDRLPPKVPAPIPSLCVQLMEGKDELIGKKRNLNIRLCLAAWNPGEHGREILIPKQTPEKLGGNIYQRWSGPEAEAHYKRNAEGWRDVWNFADAALTAVQNAEYFANMRLVKEQGITYGPFTEEGAIWDYYPYWHSWIAFTLECGIVQKTPDTYSNLL